MAVVIRVGTRTAAVPILYYGYMINLLNNYAEIVLRSG